MPSENYRSLTPHDLERAVATDLAAALEKRGAVVRHLGGASRPDIVVETPRFNIVVEVASRVGADAASEHPAIREHRKLVEFESGKTTHLLFTCWASPPRLIREMREDNSARATAGHGARSLFLDLRSLQLVLSRLAETPADLFPVARWGEWFDRWEEIGDDLVALETLQQSVFSEDEPLREVVQALVERRTQLEQEALRRDVRKLEDLLRHRNVTRNDAMRVLVYVVFVKLFEEKREAEGEENRFTSEGFVDYRTKRVSAKDRKKYEGRTLQHLIDNELSVDPEVERAKLLEHATLPRQINDDFVESDILPLLDKYRFRGTHLDALGAVFEALARRAEKDTRIGQFFTPEPIVRLAVDIARPGPTETVLDPAAGTGRFLTFSMEYMRAHAASVQGVPVAEVLRAIHSEKLLGTDADRWIVTIAKMNMYIHGDGKSNIIQENGLFLGDLPIFPPPVGTLLNRVDVCLTNPPLGEMDYQAYASDYEERNAGETGGGEWLAERLPLLPGGYVEERTIADAEAKIAVWDSRYRDAIRDGNAAAEKKALRYLQFHRERKAVANAALVSGGGSYSVAGRTAKGGALFLAAIKDYLKPSRDAGAVDEWRGGRVAIIVDEAILNTPEYAATRQFIRKYFFVKAVFSFFREAFWYQARTTAKTSLLYLYRKPDDTVVQREPTFYCHVEKIGFTRSGKPDESELPQALGSYLEFETAMQKSYRESYFDEKIAHDLLAELKLFSGVRLHWRRADAGSTGRMDFAYIAAEHIKASLPPDSLTLGDFVELVVRHPTEDPLGIYAFATVDRKTGEVRPREVTDTAYGPNNLLVVRPGDIVLSGIDVVNGAVGFAGRDVADLVVSKEFYTLRVKRDRQEDVDPRFIALLLRTPRFRELISGTVTGTSNRTRIEDANALLSMPLPELPPLEEQREIAERATNGLALRRRGRREIESALSTADHVWQGGNGVENGAGANAG